MAVVIEEARRAVADVACKKIARAALRSLLVGGGGGGKGRQRGAGGGRMRGGEGGNSSLKNLKAIVVSIVHDYKPVAVDGNATMRLVELSVA